MSSVATLGIDVPDVTERHRHRRRGETCPQCDGRHAHQWLVTRIPQPGRSDEHALRCRICGARACANIGDAPWCILRRHHREHHQDADGTLEPVGGIWPRRPA